MEIKALDTYWSDHCRHTTFLTELTEIKNDSENPNIASALEMYYGLRGELYAGREDKYPCLMDAATIAMKKLKKDGKLPALDESEEVNACSIKIKADVNGKNEDWLVMFKNETHNHPTEIEPFGGANTCIGGAIRDPMSGRSYVYQGMRVTGAADPTIPLDQTIPGKLPQRYLTRTAANGNSSYGNQIGLAAGMSREYFHPGFAAKRMEAGFVAAAAPASNVVRKKPEPGDVVILLGADTGRDGCGGATSSSKAHGADFVELCGAEVQKGNPLIERNIQRMYYDPRASRLIKRSNDFGAGGVSVAIGELADGLDVNLNAVPVKYAGLSATELAISESQERMAVVVAAEDAQAFIDLAAEENLQAVVVATVTDTNRMRLFYDGVAVADIKRGMLNSAGVRQRASAVIKDKRTDYLSSPNPETAEFLNKGDIAGALAHELSRLNVCGQKGIGEYFDFSVAGGSVTAPLGGKTGSTPVEAMAALLPVFNGKTSTATVSAHAFNPYLSEQSPFIGAVYAVAASVIRLAVSGVPLDTIYLTFQEYFPRTRDAEKWGLPLSALLGAMTAQMKLGLGSIGGKDSMSGTYENIDVPPTLISFALGVAKAGNLISNVFQPRRKIYRLPLKRDEYGMPDFDYLNELLAKISALINRGGIDAAAVVDEGGAASAVIKSCFGENIGFIFENFTPDLLNNSMGDIIVSVPGKADLKLGARSGGVGVKDGRKGFMCELLGRTTSSPVVQAGEVKIPLKDLKQAYDGTLGTIFPLKAEKADKKIEHSAYNEKPNQLIKPLNIMSVPAKPKVLIPAFPGTHGEFDMAKSFARAGADPQVIVIRNRSVAGIEDSVKAVADAISGAQIIAFPGGFTAGGEPDGGGKLVAAFFRDAKLSEAVGKFRDKRGLMLGLGDGFNALVRLGLLPSGKILNAGETGAALLPNAVNRFVSAIVKIKIASANSPWMTGCAVGEEFLTPVASASGRFYAAAALINSLKANGQIAAQYTGFNPTGSVHAIEGIFSPDGLILGKLGHADRTGAGLYMNVPGNYDMKLFEAGVKYFK